MSKPDRYVIYAQGHRLPDQYPRAYVPLFFNPSDAHAWLIKFLASNEHTREGDTLHLETDFAIRLRSEQLDLILAADPDEGSVREDHARMILRFKYGSWEESRHRPVEEEAAQDGEEETTEAPVKEKPKREKAEKAPRLAKQAVPEGWTTIGQICEELGIPASVGRAALRSSGLNRPAFGWSFDPKDVPGIRKLCKP